MKVPNLVATFASPEGGLAPLVCLNALSAFLPAICFNITNAPRPSLLPPDT
jgi:hypothetical protein